jgi:kumamolisin
LPPRSACHHKTVDAGAAVPSECDPFARVCCVQIRIGPAFGRAARKLARTGAISIITEEHMMFEKRVLRVSAAIGMTALSALGSGAAWAAGASVERTIAGPDGMIVIPGSSARTEADRGVNAHTNIQLFFPRGVRAQASVPSGKYETPASLACIYGLTPLVTGCNPSTLTTVTTGGSKAIGIVDAYDYPTAVNDLSVFSTQFGLPPVTKSNFVIAYGSGKKPKQDSTGGWELEEALDIEMAHALAPNAKVILVEAKSASFKDLLAAEAVAATMVAAAGGGEVSNSWSGGEFTGEKRFEKSFQVPGVVYLASAGDSSGIGVPAALNDVIAVGGTSINRDSKYNFLNQSTWTSSGGGSSAYIVTPKFQKPVANLVGATRGTPDISLIANPSTGVWEYDTTPYGGKVYDWLVIGGTSVASPALAGILNNAGSFAKSTVAELTTVYKGFTNAANWTDITLGTCGNNGGAKALTGWDFCTGVGVPQGLAGK